ncbi:hypothetical protein [Sphingobium sp. MK2]|uniref:hypothetical protein n=1 Tax=Sphingobium sp. MK2 TaxID=3116540 RepID=UPI0032E35D4A
MSEWADWCDMRENAAVESTRRSAASQQARRELEAEGTYSLNNLITRTNQILDRTPAA